MPSFTFYSVQPSGTTSRKTKSSMFRRKTGNLLICRVLKGHFKEFPLHTLVSAGRIFPAPARLDLHFAVTSVLSGPMEPKKILGIHAPHAFRSVAFAQLIMEGQGAALVSPLQYDEIDTGEVEPVRCLRNALWLCVHGGTPFAVYMNREEQHGRPGGINLEIAVPPGEQGSELVRTLFRDIERAVSKAGSYRGKVLSLDASDNYWGGVEGVRVHRLKTVERDQVILPQKTLGLLERNVASFAAQRPRLREMQMGIKKGLLFYGPPGTGKTHTIHYLASQMKEHTTLLITADQVALLDAYMQLARFLQPAIVVIEDADLIARSRAAMHSPCEESLLNRLLNEMDGLREDAMVLFILTTNRPDQLEQALTSRPGRIDQAIEFPLPDDEGRRKLLHLYSGSLELPDDLMSFLVKKTAGGSGAFIKELMRRSAQFLLESGDQGLEDRHIEAALDEMLFSGGSLNAKLLGLASQGPGFHAE